MPPANPSSQQHPQLLLPPLLHHRHPLENMYLGSADPDPKAHPRPHHQNPTGMLVPAWRTVAHHQVAVTGGAGTILLVVAVDPQGLGGAHPGVSASGVEVLVFALDNLW